MKTHVLTVDESMPLFSAPNLVAKTLEELTRKRMREEKILIEFAEPVPMFLNQCKRRTLKELKVAGVFRAYDGDLCYLTRRSSRRGYRFGHALGKVKSIFLVNEDLYFDSLSKFSRRFDRRFISDAEIERLFTSTSRARGERFDKLAFRSLTRKGRRVMDNFLRRFRDVYTPTEFYDERGVLTVDEEAYSNNGRRITIQHVKGREMVFYSSEFAGCGNGDYYIVASEKRVLFVERD